MIGRKDEPWYHQNTNRLRSEEILLENGQEGAFLIRESESIVNAHVLSLLCKDGVQHYRIMRNPDNKITLQASEGVQQCFFETLSHLVSYYTVPDPNRGLPVELRIAIEEVRSSNNEGGEDSDLEDAEEDSYDSSEYPVALFFQQQLEAIKGIRVDDNFREKVKDYVNKDIKIDVQKIESGASRPPYFQRLIVVASKELEETLQKYKRRLNFLQELFDVGPNTTIKKMTAERSEDGDDKMNIVAGASDLEHIITLLSETKTSMLMLERRAHKILQDYCGPNSLEERRPSSVEHETYQLIDDSETRNSISHGGSEKDNLKINKLFQVTLGPWKTKQVLSVDVKRGKIKITKTVEDSADTAHVFKHDQILQLLKSKTYKNKLAVVMDNKVVKNYQFEDFKSRELFCQLLQQMKNLHSSATEKEQLSIFVGTWNMGDATPPAEITSWFQCQGLGRSRDATFSEIPYDLVAVGTQETSLHEKEWVNRLSADLNRTFNCNYKLVGACSLWSLRLVILIKSELSNKVSHLKQSSVKTGIANKLGNKGAVAISFNYGSTSFCFINCHLTSGFERLKRRNENFHDILQGLKLGNDGLFDLTLKFNHCFWFGDLNYRIDLDTEDILKRIAKNELKSLKSYDQLCVEQEKGSAFFSFEEPPVQFRPTYRYVRGETHMYSVTKVKRTGTRTNVPSWCDRVLFKTHPGIYIDNTAYGCTENILTSDHFPVFSCFDVGVLLQSVLGPDCDSHNLSSRDVKVALADIKAKVRTSCTSKFILSIHSSCLEEPLTSQPNSVTDWRSLSRLSTTEDVRLFSYPEWTQAELPVVVPVLSYQNYLEDQHLLIAIKGEDGHESYGECVVSLKKLLANDGEPYRCVLTHLGYEAGDIRLQAIVSIPSKSQGSVYRTRDRDLISVADLDEEELRYSVDPLGEDLTRKRATHLSLERSESSFPYSEYLKEISKSDMALHRSDSDPPALPPKKKLSHGAISPRASQAPNLIWIGAENEFVEEANKNIDKADTTPDATEPGQTMGEAADTSCTPPVPKPRTLKSLLRKSPATIGQWLQRIGLPQYESNLIDEGWDDIDFLHVMTIQDLESAGIVDEEHRQMIMKSAKLLFTQREKERSKQSLCPDEP